MSDCLFCRIVSREIPSDVVFENGVVFAFMDIRPINEGHVLVISKSHFVDLFDTPDDVLGALMSVAKSIGKAVMRSIGADGINIGMNNKSAAGQVIFHTHMHVIPRELSDGLKHWPHRDVSADELKGTAARIRDALDRADPSPRPKPVMYDD